MASESQKAPVRVWVESNRDKDELEKFVRDAGFKLDEKEPEVVITYGGDGSILHAEHKYPGVPKLPIRENTISAKCETYSVGEIPKILAKLSEGKFKVYEQSKVEATLRDRKLVGLNEVQIHTRLPTSAIRFSFESPKAKHGEVIVDGIIASTPHGSTAYYRSAGGKPFDKGGVRIAFNNVWPERKPADVNSGESAKVTILRDRAWLAADNNPEMFDLKPNDVVEIRESEQKAKFVKF